MTCGKLPGNIAAAAWDASTADRFAGFGVDGRWQRNADHRSVEPELTDLSYNDRYAVATIATENL
jgi:hypothetical protein